MDLISLDMVVHEHEQGLNRLYGSLAKLLRPKGGFSFCGSLGSVLFVQPFVGHWVQGLLCIWTRLPGTLSFKNNKMGQVRLHGNLTEMLRPEGGFLFYGSVWSILFVQPFGGVWVQGYLVHGPYFLGYDRSRTGRWVKLDYMAAYLNCCVPRADFYFMEAKGLHYLYCHFWVLW